MSNRNSLWRALMVIVCTNAIWPLCLKADDEQAIRNEISIARSAVSNMEARVKSARTRLDEKLKAYQALQNEKAVFEKKLVSVRSNIQVKRQAKILVEKQLRRKIKKLEADLQQAVDDKKPTEVLLYIDRRTQRYRKELVKF